MAHKKKAVRSFTAIFVIVTICTISDGLAEILCPSSVKIEYGSTVPVACNITEKQIIRVYWYKGDIARTNPILRLENGNPGGTEYGAGHYNISGSGAMIITNATVLQEAIYTTLMYFHDGTSESSTIQVNITITPWPSCPLIDACVPCKDCILPRNENGKLTCTIRGIRPMVNLEWIIETQSGISIVEHPPVFTKDLSSDSWNGSVDISYGVSSCNQEASIECVAQDHLSLLDHSSSKVRIYTVNCTEVITSSNKLSTMKTIVILAVFVGVVLVVIVLILVITNRRRRITVRRKGLVPIVRYELVTDASPGTVMETGSSSGASSEDAIKLVNLLKERYRSGCFANPLPWESTTGVEDLSAIFSCKVAHTNRSTSLITMDKLFASNVIEDERHVFIAGRPRHWETLFTKHVVGQWIGINENDFILLSICTKEVNTDNRLIDFLSGETSIDSKILVKGIESKKCILFFHGLPTVKFDNTEAKVLGSGEKSCGKTRLVDYKISDLFTERSHLFHIHVWIMLQNKERINDIFSFPCAKVDVNVIDEHQFDEFLETVYYNLKEKSCSGRSPSFNGAGEMLSEETNNSYNNDKSTNKNVTSKTELQNEGNQHEHPSRTLKTPASEAKNIENKKPSAKGVTFGHIKNILLHSELYQEFKETPAALAMIVHTILREYLYQASDMKDLTKLTVEEIVRIVINSLQSAYFNKHGKVKPAKFEESLGNFALSQLGAKQNVIGKESSATMDSSNDLMVGIAIGILEHSIRAPIVQLSSENTESFSSQNVEFSHKYFKYYFAANYLILNKIFYTDTLAKEDASQNFRVFKLILHLAPRPITQALSTFLKFQAHEDMISLLYKWDNQDGVEKVMEELRGAKIHITSFDRMDENAFASFCEKCIDMEIKWKSLTIDGSFPLVLVTSLDFQITDTLTLFDLELLEDEFLKILEWLSKKDITLRFLDCKVPVKFSDRFEEETGKIDEFKVKTILQPDMKDPTDFSFDYKTAKWKLLPSKVSH